MNFHQFSKQVAKEAKITVPECKRILVAMVIVLNRLLMSGHTIYILKFLNFKLDIAQARKFNDPRNNNMIEKPNRFKLVVTQTSHFKKLISAKKAY